MFTKAAKRDRTENHASHQDLYKESEEIGTIEQLLCSQEPLNNLPR